MKPLKDPVTAEDLRDVYLSLSGRLNDLAITVHAMRVAIQQMGVKREFLDELEERLRPMIAAEWQNHLNEMTADQVRVAVNELLRKFDGEPQ